MHTNIKVLSACAFYFSIAKIWVGQLMKCFTFEDLLMLLECCCFTWQLLKVTSDFGGGIVKWMWEDLRIFTSCNLGNCRTFFSFAFTVSYSWWFHEKNNYWNFERLQQCSSHLWASLNWSGWLVFISWDTGWFGLRELTFTGIKLLQVLFSFWNLESLFYCSSFSFPKGWEQGNTHTFFSCICSY